MRQLEHYKSIVRQLMHYIVRQLMHYKVRQLTHYNFMGLPPALAK